MFTSAFVRQVAQLAANNASEAFKTSLKTTADSLTEAAAKTENPWDDVLALVVQSVVSSLQTGV